MDHLTDQLEQRHQTQPAPGTGAEVDDRLPLRPLPTPQPPLPPVGPDGRALRLILLDELRRRGQSSVAELVPIIAAYGPPTEGRRISKLISDALRWEVRAGRVVKVERGIYRYGTAPRSRRRRAAILAKASRTWCRANNHTVPDRQPPWTDLTWLWVR